MEPSGFRLTESSSDGRRVPLVGNSALGETPSRLAYAAAQLSSRRDAAGSVSTKPAACFRSILYGFRI